MRKLLFLLVVLSCESFSVLNPGMMLKTSIHPNYRKLNNSITTGYKISPNDFITMNLFSQEGFKIVDISNSTITDTEYLVESDGTIKLPIIGRTSVEGLTLQEVTQLLEQKYSQYYIRPSIVKVRR